MAKQHFLMLAHKYEKQPYIGGYFVSEKLDGMRCFWDGGVTHGFKKSMVPWANTEKDKKEEICTGLWSRYGNVIHAPQWFTDGLPNCPLDGELWTGRGEGKRQVLMSIVKKKVPDSVAWRKVSYPIFGSPSPQEVFKDRHVKLTNFDKWFEGCHKFFNDLGGVGFEPKQFWLIYKILEQCLPEHGEHVYCLGQKKLPTDRLAAIAMIDELLTEVCDNHGEGLMLRKPESIWIPERVHQLLKVKKLQDAEGTVIGYTTGRETDKGSRLLGKMGALILRLDSGIRLELSGFTDEERCLISYGVSDARDWAELNPEKECPDWIEALYFPRGDKVTFRYQDKSRDGVPQSARYWRKYHVE